MFLEQLEPRKLMTGAPEISLLQWQGDDGYGGPAWTQDLDDGISTTEFTSAVDELVGGNARFPLGNRRFPRWKQLFPCPFGRCAAGERATEFFATRNSFAAMVIAH